MSCWGPIGSAGAERSIVGNFTSQLSGLSSSLGFVGAFGPPVLPRGWLLGRLLVLLLLLLMALGALVPAVRVTPAPLLMLTTLLVPLLKATPELLGPRIGIPARVGHWTARVLLQMAIRRLAMLHVRAHAVHRLSLLGALMGHHGRRRPPGAGVTRRSGARLRRTSRWKKLGVSPRVHHLRAANHPLRPWHKVRLHHHGTSHLSLLGRHILWVARKTSELTHLRSARPHVDWLVIWQLRRGVHTWVCHRRLAEARRGE